MGNVDLGYMALSKMKKGRTLSVLILAVVVTVPDRHFREAMTDSFGHFQVTDIKDGTGFLIIQATGFKAGGPVEIEVQKAQCLQVACVLAERTGIYT